MKEIYARSVDELLYSRLGQMKKYRIRDVITFRFEHLRIAGRPIALSLVDLLTMEDVRKSPSTMTSEWLIEHGPVGVAKIDSIEQKLLPYRLIKKKVSCKGVYELTYMARTGMYIALVPNEPEVTLDDLIPDYEDGSGI